MEIKLACGNIVLGFKKFHKKPHHPCCEISPVRGQDRRKSTQDICPLCENALLVRHASGAREA